MEGVVHEGQLAKVGLLAYKATLRKLDHIRAQEFPGPRPALRLTVIAVLKQQQEREQLGPPGWPFLSPL